MAPAMNAVASFFVFTVAGSDARATSGKIRARAL
jgi:hypothetical protein